MRWLRLCDSRLRRASEPTSVLQKGNAMKAAIIGGGVIGGGWAARFLLNGWDVDVFDPDPEAKRKLDAVLTNARRALPMLYEHSLPPEGRLRLVETLPEAVSDADYIQESVPERLDLKHRVLAEVEVAAPEAPIGSSTSGFKPSELRKGCLLYTSPSPRD